MNLSKADNSIKRTLTYGPNDVLFREIRLSYRRLSHDRSNITIFIIIVLLVDIAKLLSNLWFAEQYLLLFKKR